MTSEFFAARINAQEVIYNDVKFSGELKTRSFCWFLLPLLEHNTVGMQNPEMSSKLKNRNLSSIVNPQHFEKTKFRTPSYIEIYLCCCNVLV